MMGIITEDKSDVMLKMVNKIGLFQTIKFIGGYKRFKKYLGDTELPKHNMIDFIKEVVMMWMEVSRQPGISILETSDKPIDCGSDEDFTRQTQFLSKDTAYVDVYDNKPLGMMSDSYMIPYEDLPKDSLEKIFEIMIDFVMKYNITER
jgi:hypothetical protein